MSDKMNNEFIPVRPSEAVIVIEHTMSKGRPCMVWGPPGIGKSDIIAQIGAKNDRPVIDLRLLLMEPTDLKGIPFYNPESHEMEWAKPSELPAVVNPESLRLAEATVSELQGAMWAFHCGDPSESREKYNTAIKAGYKQTILQDQRYRWTRST